MNVATLLVRAGRASRERPAVIVGSRLYADYGTFARRVAGLAGALAGRFGLVPGDRVAIVMANRAAYLEVLLACWHAGLAAVPVNARLHPREVAFILGHSAARLCFLDAVHAEVASAPADGGGPAAFVSVDDADYARLVACDPLPMVPRQPTDLAWLFYTSGTTGRPKGAMLSHRNLLAMTLAYFADVDTIAPGDCILHPAPLSHGSGMYVLPHLAAAAAQVIPESGGFDPDEIASLLAARAGCAFFAAPTMVRRLIDSAVAIDLDHLKTIVYGGGPMYASDIERALDRLGPRLAQIYGQGESPMTITALARARHADRAHPRYRQRLSSVGLPHSVVEVMVAEAGDRPLPAGEVGEVLVRGDTVMAGYWRDPEATATTLRGGWLHTGDVGSLDDDGFLTLKDRSKDLIISGGSNVYPREVEEVLLRHSAVAEVSVVGAPDADWGECVVAFVVAAPGATPEPAALDALCLDHLARFKRPKRYVMMDALPKNNYGKVLKTELRRRLADREESPP
jgi:long-chain acyl-CoA synthetase